MVSVGNRAFEFHLHDENGNKVSLSDYSEHTVVLFFYPKDDTPGCTVQACNYRDAAAEFAKRNVKVIGISRDDVHSHARFKQKHNLNFTLLADTEGETVNQYGVWKEKSLFGVKYMGISRTTFVIEKGIITAIFESVDPNTDVDTILQFLDHVA